MKNEQKEKGSHITLEHPISSEDLHKKLFTAVMLPHSGYKPKDNIYLYITKKQELNRRVFFSNHTFNKSEYVLVGKYKYQNFCSPDDAALAFSQTITDRVIKLSGAT